MGRPGQHAAGCARLVHRRRRRTLAPFARGGVAGVGVRRRRGAGAGPPAGVGLRADRLEPSQDRPDCYARVGRAIYTVPWRFIGCRLDARDSGRTVEFYRDGQVVKTWAWAERGRQTDWADFPPEKVAFFMHTPQWCLKRAGELGEHVKALVEGLLGLNALYRLRQAQGVVHLADKHGAVRLDAACRRAIDIGDPEYRTVKGILVAGTEDDGTEQPPAPDAPAHLHGPVRLFDGLDQAQGA